MGKFAGFRTIHTFAMSFSPDMSVRAHVCRVLPISCSLQMPTVTANRQAEHLNFVPTSALPSNTMTGLTARFEAKTDLEKQVDSLLTNSVTVIKAQKGLSDAEELALRCMFLPVEHTRGKGRRLDGQILTFMRVHALYADCQ